MWPLTLLSWVLAFQAGRLIAMGFDKWSAWSREQKIDYLLWAIAIHLGYIVVRVLGSVT